MSAWATAAHAAAAPDARLLYATTTEEFVQAWEPCRDAVQHLPRRRAAAAHTRARSSRSRCGWTRGRRPQDRRPASPGQPDHGAVRGAGRGTGTAVVVDRDLRRRRCGPRPHARTRHLRAGCGVSSATHPDPPVHLGGLGQVGARTSEVVPRLRRAPPYNTIVMEARRRRRTSYPTRSDRPCPPETQRMRLGRPPPLSHPKPPLGNGNVAAVE